MSLERVIHIIRSGTALGCIDNLQYSDPFLLPTLIAISLVDSLYPSSHPHIAGQATNYDAIISPITPEWAFNLVGHFVSPDSCALQVAFPHNPKLQISSRNGTTIDFLWDANPEESHDGPLYIGWVNWPHSLIYTPITLTSVNSGRVSIPGELWGFAVAVLTAEAPDNVNELTSKTISGPVMVEVVF